MKIKQNVDVQMATPQLLLGIMVAESVYARAGHELTLTSIRDGKHSSRSFHYDGDAVDLRTIAAGIQIEAARDLALAIAKNLPGTYDVVVEDDHIHLEFDRRRANLPLETQGT